MTDIEITMTPETTKKLKQFVKNAETITALFKAETKFIKKYGAEALETLKNKDKEALEKSIADSVRFIEETKEQLESSPKYQEVKEDLAALKGALNDTVKPHKDAIRLAALLLMESF
jgi:hypothetical protein